MSGHATAGVDSACQRRSGELAEGWEAREVEPCLDGIYLSLIKPCMRVGSVRLGAGRYRLFGPFAFLGARACLAVKPSRYESKLSLSIRRRPWRLETLLCRRNTLVMNN